MPKEPPKDLSAAFESAFLEELAAARASGAAPAAFRFEDGRWFVGASPPPGAPLVVFSDNSIIVGTGDSPGHHHVFPGGDDTDSIRQAARDIVQELCSEWGRSSATPRAPRPELQRRLIGACWGGLLAFGIWWAGLSVSGPRMELRVDEHVFMVAFLLGSGALLGALLLAPPR